MHEDTTVWFSHTNLTLLGILMPFDRQGYFDGTGTIMLLSQLLWNNSKKYTNGLMQMRRNSMAEEL